MFYHGNHPLSPLHEGAVVTQGIKYVVRTDVLYDVSTMPDFESYFGKSHECQVASRILKLGRAEVVRMLARGERAIGNLSSLGRQFFGGGVLVGHGS